MGPHHLVSHSEGGQRGRGLVCIGRLAARGDPPHLFHLWLSAGPSHPERSWRMSEWLPSRLPCRVSESSTSPSTPHRAHRSPLMTNHTWGSSTLRTCRNSPPTHIGDDDGRWRRSHETANHTPLFRGTLTPKTSRRGSSRLPPGYLGQLRPSSRAVNPCHTYPATIPRSARHTPCPASPSTIFSIHPSRVGRPRAGVVPHQAGAGGAHPVAAAGAGGGRTTRLSRPSTMRR